MNVVHQFRFCKYQGTGNDFVMVDNRDIKFPKDNAKLIAKICHRRFGIGADGLILLEKDNLSDFKMIYFNSDGKESTMCGNGGRCLVAFAKELGIVDDNATFTAIDGLHKAEIHLEDVTLHMSNVTTVRDAEKYFYLNTGSPHHVQEVKNIDTIDVKTEGSKIRYGLYGVEGSNINFVEQQTEDTFKVRTYERGVEDETLSCGTGVTAVALAMNNAGKSKATKIKVLTNGGVLEVQFAKSGEGYTHITLTGPAKKVFEGEWRG